MYRSLFRILPSEGHRKALRQDSRALWFAAVVLLAMAGPAAISLRAQQQPWITGYYSAGNKAMPISAIPWSKYTHVIHFAASTPGDGSVSMNYLTQTDISQIMAARPAGKKVLVCIKDNDADYNAFGHSTSSGSIAGFVNSIAAFVNNNGYDGVDLDWEKNINAAQFEDLLVRLRTALPNKVITIAANPGNAAVAAVSQASLDQVNVMCYDMDWGSSVAWYVGALLQNGNSGANTCDADIAQFTSAGLAAGKIGVGMPFYGRRWPGATQALQSSSFNNATTFFYRDLVNDSTRWQPQYKFYDSGYKANYLSIPSLSEFDSYTGPEFINDAVSWGKAKGFGGYMTFTIEYEYLAGQAGDAAYPLSTALASAVSGAPVPVGGTTGSTGTTTTGTGSTTSSGSTSGTASGTATSTGTSTGTASGSTSTTAASQAAPSVNGVTNAASFAAEPASPASIFTLFGSNLASGTASASAVPLPTSLLGTTLKLNGVAAPLYYVSPTQINFQVPRELAGVSQAALTLEVNGVTGSASTLSLAPVSPGLFGTNQQGGGQGAILIANSSVLAAPAGTTASSRPAKRGEYISIFCSGLGAVSNPPADGAPASTTTLSSTSSNPSVSIGGVPAQVSFSGLAPGFVGLYQVNVQVPANAPAGDSVAVVLNIAGVASNAVTISVQ